eukprot:jgi/Mesen1/1830/ME000142S00997
MPSTKRVKSSPAVNFSPAAESSPGPSPPTPAPPLHLLSPSSPGMGSQPAAHSKVSAQPDPSEHLDGEWSESPGEDGANVPTGSSAMAMAMADVLFGVGGFHFFVSMVPSSFTWIVESLGFRGDREAGRRELQLAAGASGGGAEEERGGGGR